MKRVLSMALAMVMSLGGNVPGPVSAVAAGQAVVSAPSAPELSASGPLSVPALPSSSAEAEALLARQPNLAKLEVWGGGGGSEPEAWVDRGNSWGNAGGPVRTEVRKTYEKNAALVRLSRGETSISFAPIMIERQAQQGEVAAGRQLSARQSASNVLRVGAGQGRPQRVQGRLGGAGRGASGGGRAAPAVYEGLFEAGTDVELTALSGGVKENVVIGGYTGGHVYAYEMRLSGLVPRQQGGEIRLLGSGGEQAARIAAPYMYDAAGARSEAIAVSLREQGPGVWLLSYTPDDAWLGDAGRAYPVVLDPQAQYLQEDDQVQDAYVFSNWKDRNFGYEDDLYSGNSSGETYGSFIQMAFPDAMRGKSVLIQKAEFSLHSEGGYEGSFLLSTVQGSWGEGTITYRNQPMAGGPQVGYRVHGNGWDTADITAIASRWFDTQNQVANHGIALSGAPSGGTYKRFQSMQSGDRPRFTYYYWAQLPQLNARATGHAASRDAAEGWVELTWDKADGIAGYYVGVYTGKRDAQGNALYEYIYVGDVDHYSTRGKGLWPTAGEIAAGKYDLHKSGGGAELAGDPFPVYQNAGDTQRAGDVNYYFKVVPSNSVKQLPGDAQVPAVSAIVPIDRPPSKPVSVSVSPAGWTNGDAVAVNWAGTVYYDYEAQAMRPELGEGGYMAYAVVSSPVEAEGAAWQTTGSVLGTDGFTLATRSAAEPDPGEEPAGDAGEPESAPWADGVYYVLIRGVGGNGKAGEYRPAPVYVDRTPPSAPAFSATPKAWSNAGTAGLTWSGISDLTDLARVEWRADEGAWQDTGRADKTYVGHEQDTSMLSDGHYTISLRGVDLAGNLGEISQDDIWIDRCGPTVEEAGFRPGSYSAANKLVFYWQGLRDAHSGLEAAGYAWGGEALQGIDTGRENGEVTFDVSGWADGPYQLSFERVDQTGNVAVDTLRFYRDTVAPVARLVSPAEGDVLGGITEVWAQIEDDTLASWRLTATGANGRETLLAEGSEPCAGELLTLLSTLQFEDGERVRLRLYAQDRAGNSAEQSVTVSMARVTPLAAEVNIVSPVKGEVVREPGITGRYEVQYSGRERQGSVYLDGELGPPLAGRTVFPVEGILYPEGSVHSVAVISEDGAGGVHYSQGLGARLLASEALGAGMATVGASEGVTRTAEGVGIEGGEGWIESVEVRNNRPMFGLRLRTREALAGGAIAYRYSTDGGASWQAVEPGRDVRFAQPSARVQVRARFSGAAGELGYRGRCGVEPCALHGAADAGGERVHAVRGHGAAGAGRAGQQPG